MIRYKGFLYHNTENGRIGINWRETHSVVVADLLLEEILGAKGYFKGHLLDVGCGKRPYSLVYDSLVESSIGTEVSFSLHGLAQADVMCCAESLPFVRESYDTILCTEVLEHTIQPFLAISEFSRLLKPGGYLILSVPFIYPLHEAPHDFWRFTTHGLEELCRSAELVPVSIHTKGGIGGVIVALSVNVVVRVINVVSKILRMSTPLRDLTIIRWLIALPQWIYLWLHRKLPEFAMLQEAREWMTTGFILIASRPK